MRLVYLGSPEVAVEPLRALVEAGHEIALVVSQPDRKRGRGAELNPTPVKQAAEELGLTVVTPQSAGDITDQIAATGAQLGVVVAFGQLLSRKLLDALPHGFINIHFSNLPRWRGAAPVQRAILAGDAETGVSIFQLVEELDAGPVFLCAHTPVNSRETAGELEHRLAHLGTGLLVDLLSGDFAALEVVPQEGTPTYANKLTVEEFQLDWNQSAEQLNRIIRAGNPRPGAFMFWETQRVKILRSEVVKSSAKPGVLDGDVMGARKGGLRLLEVQPEGKRVMTGQEWIVGLRK